MIAGQSSSQSGVANAAKCREADAKACLIRLIRVQHLSAPQRVERVVLFAEERRGRRPLLGPARERPALKIKIRPSIKLLLEIQEMVLIEPPLPFVQPWHLTPSVCARRPHLVVHRRGDQVVPLKLPQARHDIQAIPLTLDALFVNLDIQSWIRCKTAVEWS